MRLPLFKLLGVVAIITSLLLIASCADNTVPEPSEPQIDTVPGPDCDLELVSGSDSWQIGCLFAWTKEQAERWRPDWDWTLTEGKLWGINYDEGINYIDTETGDKTTVSTSNYHNTMFVTADSFWFTYNSLWGYHQMFPKDQLPLARYDLATEQYYEYPVDIFTGVNATIIEALGKVIVLAGDQLYEYDQVSDEFIQMPEYGEDVWRIAGNENILAVYSGIYTQDYSLKLCYANSKLEEYNPLECLPGTHVTEMNIVRDELFIWWGGEGSPTGVACLNTQTGEWVQYLDKMSETDFSTSLEYTQLSGIYGEIWVRGEDAVYLPIMNANPKSLLKFSFETEEFESVYMTEESIRDAIPLRNGDIIAQYNGLVFHDEDNTYNILENVVVSQVIQKDENTVLAITEQGIFECKYIE